MVIRSCSGSWENEPPHACQPSLGPYNLHTSKPLSAPALSPDPGSYDLRPLCHLLPTEATWDAQAGHTSFFSHSTNGTGIQLIHRSAQWHTLDLILDSGAEISAEMHITLLAWALTLCPSLELTQLPSLSHGALSSPPPLHSSEIQQAPPFRVANSSSQCWLGGPADLKESPGRLSERQGHLHHSHTSERL